MRANRTVGAVLDSVGPVPDEVEPWGTMTVTMMAEPGEVRDEDEASSAADRSAADQALARRMLQSLRHRQDERRSKVERLREAIRSNSYENPPKLSVALDRLVNKVGGRAGDA